MTDITELAQREKFEAWAEHACAAPWGYLKKRRTTEGYSEQIYTCMWTAWKAASAELVEALEKAQQYAKERDEENQDLMLTVGRLRVEREGLEAIRTAAEKLVRCKGRYHSELNYRALAALFGVNTPDLPPLEHENVHYADAAEMEIAALRQRIAELEREQEHLRPVGVMSEQAFHRLENSECRFIALWPRPDIFLPRKRPEDGVIVYARIGAAAGIKWEGE
ncbi:MULTISPECIES: ead/Ea22-like family protein [unclassified Raoultella]|uniref:ead/Ea22-like family protein n=1 Tax=unclassified Raoultella TaxID=2627600 RepID=UPI001D10ED5F